MESSFIVDVLSRMKMPKHKSQEEEDSDEEMIEQDQEQRNKMNGNKTQRAGSIMELQERFRSKMENLKGKGRKDRQQTCLHINRHLVHL